MGTSTYTERLPSSRSAMTDPRRLRFPFTSNPRIEKHQPQNTSIRSVLIFWVFPRPDAMRHRRALMKDRRDPRDACQIYAACGLMLCMGKFTQLLFSYQGRINRKTYLLYHVCGLGGYFLVAYAFMDFIMPVRDTLHPELQYLLHVVQVLLGFLGLLLFYGTYPVTVKRLHDTNVSGKVLWTRCTFPLIGQFYYCYVIILYCPFVSGTNGKNAYGESAE